MLDQSVNLLEELDNISRIHWNEREDIDHLMHELAKRIVASLHIERVSIWLLNPEQSALISIGEFDIRTRSFNKNNILLREKYPSYFDSLNENKVILAEDIHQHPATKEFSSEYSKPLGIESLMDIPIRIEGDLIGVICFEKTGVRHIFTSAEQTFAMCIASTVASNLEARHRRTAQHKLKQALLEKDLLIKEINHRVKNNFSILISLLRISRQQSKMMDPVIILAEYEQRITSMLKIHDLLCQTENYTSVNLCAYMNELVSEFTRSNLKMHNLIHSKIDSFEYNLPTKTAIHVGLLVSEIFLNAVKYSNYKMNGYEFLVELKLNESGKVNMKIGDNGPGFDFEKKVKKDTLGLQIIQGLAEGMEAEIRYPNLSNNYYVIEL